MEQPSKKTFGFTVTGAVSCIILAAITSLPEISGPKDFADDLVALVGTLAAIVYTFTFIAILGLAVYNINKMFKKEEANILIPIAAVLSIMFMAAFGNLSLGIFTLGALCVMEARDMYRRAQKVEWLFEPPAELVEDLF